jgi:yeast amino acid transporter
MSKSNSDEFPVGEKGAYTVDDHHTHDDDLHGVRGIEVPGSANALHRGLKARHITMIAIGGAIGTGLIIGTGKALATSGPGSIFIAYTVIGFLVFLVMAALGEMAAYLPMGSGFTGYASRFASPSLGFALGWT